MIMTDKTKEEIMHDKLQNYCFMQSKQILEQQENFLKIHIRTRPKRIPKKLYTWIISKILRLDMFQK